MISLQGLQDELIQLVSKAEDGPPLDEQTQVLIGLAVRSSAASLDVKGMEQYISKGLDLGLTPGQLHEVMVLVSGLGVHTLMEGSRRLSRISQARGVVESGQSMDERSQKLWEKYVGDDKYWDRMEREVPGFLRELLRNSPEAFEAFFRFCAVPWRGRALTPLTKELISIAVDSASTHRYMPGLRLHVANALTLGAGRVAILQTAKLAALAPEHPGVN